jgi:hypothetical protein
VEQLLGEPALKTGKESGLLDAGIIVGGLALATALVCVRHEAGPHSPHVLWYLDRIGAVSIYGMSIRFKPMTRKQSE